MGTTQDPEQETENPLLHDVASLDTGPGTEDQKEITGPGRFELPTFAFLASQENYVLWAQGTKFPNVGKSGVNHISQK